MGLLLAWYLGLGMFALLGLQALHWEQRRRALKLERQRLALIALRVRRRLGGK